MTAFKALVRRDCKLFFKDKGMFFSSLITPLILLVLYSTFLADIYHDSFSSALPVAMLSVLPDDLIDGTVGSQLFSSLLAVSCVTVSFCSNLMMVQDKANGVRRDLTVSPVRGSTLALGYYVSTVLSTMLVCLVAMLACFAYLSAVGWYLSVTDILLLTLDVFLLVLFGTALSSIVNFFLTTQGQMSAVGTIVSAGYGFLCGAYMPISQFGEGLQKVLSFMPGTYGTSLLRNHAMRGVFAEMERCGFPAEVVESIRDSVDCNLYFLADRSSPVSEGTMYLILGGMVALLIAIYVVMNLWKKKD